jgi:hypothetical protein
VKAPASALPDARALIGANQRAAADVARAVAAASRSGVVTAIGHWAADGEAEPRT